MRQVAYSRQATAFCALHANIYAPYYRQADAAWSLSLPAAEHAKVEKGEPTHDAIAAFDYYIKHYNHGRPFILAGHSQGSNVIIYLLSQYMHRHPKVYKRMIAAYIPGLLRDLRSTSTTTTSSSPRGANDTWSQSSRGTRRRPTTAAPDPCVPPARLAINPLTWTRDADRGDGRTELRFVPVLDPATGRPET